MCLCEKERGGAYPAMPLPSWVGLSQGRAAPPRHTGQTPGSRAPGVIGAPFATPVGERGALVLRGVAPRGIYPLRDPPQAIHSCAMHPGEPGALASCVIRLKVRAAPWSGSSLSSLVLERFLVLTTCVQGFFAPQTPAGGQCDKAGRYGATRLRSFPPRSGLLATLHKAPGSSPG